MNCRHSDLERDSYLGRPNMRKKAQDSTRYITQIDGYNSTSRVTDYLILPPTAEGGVLGQWSTAEGEDERRRGYASQVWHCACSLLLALARFGLDLKS